MANPVILSTIERERARVGQQAQIVSLFTEGCSVIDVANTMLTTRHKVEAVLRSAILELSKLASAAPRDSV